MRTAFCLPALLSLAFLAACQTTPKETIVHTSSVAVTATEEQLLMGKHRAEAITSRWTDEEKGKFAKRKSPYLAVRTLSLSPEQYPAVGSKVRAPAEAACIVIWNAKTSKMVDNQLFVTDSPPEKGAMAGFGAYTAEYKGSF